MRGINYMIDENGDRTAIVIDLKTYGEEIEDFLDGLEAESRKNEPKEEFNLVFERVLQAKTTDD